MSRIVYDIADGTELSLELSDAEKRRLDEARAMREERLAKEAMHAIGVYLPLDVFEVVEKRAAAAGIKCSAYIRDVVIQHIKG